MVSTWLRVIRRRWPIGVGLLVAITGLAAALVLLAHPVWRAEAALRLGAQPNVGGASLAATGAPAGLMSLFQQMTGDPLANEMELISSRTVIEEVVRANALQVTVRAPRGIYRDSVLSQLSVPGEAAKATFEATWTPAGTIRVMQTAPVDSLIGDFTPGQPAQFGGILAIFRSRTPSLPESIVLSTVPFGEAVRVTRTRLIAERQRRDANLVRISYDGTDPDLALAVVRSGIAHYWTLRAELQRRESMQTTDSLRTLSDQTLAQLRREEDSLEGFQEAAGIVAPAAQADAFIERRTEVASRLEHARGELARTDEVLARLAGATDPGAAWVGLVAHPTFLTNVTLGDLLTNLITLEQERIALRGRRTEADGQVQSLEQRIAYLDTSLRSLIREYREGIAAGIPLLEAQATELDTALASMPGDGMEMRRRERTLRQLSEIYLFTDQRLWQESLRNAVSFATVQMVDPPGLLFKPIWPRKKLGIAVGLLLGLAFGALGMALTEGADRSVRTTRELSDRLGAPVIATIYADGGGSDLTPGDRRVILHGRNGNGPRRVLLAPASERSGAEAVARALAGSSDPVEAGVGTFTIPAGSLTNARHAGEEIRHSRESGNPEGWQPLLDSPERQALDSRFRGNDEYAPVVIGPIVDRYSAAALLADAAGHGAEILLVVRYGVTRMDEADRAVAFLREAGARATGVVMVVDDPRMADAVWQ